MLQSDKRGDIMYRMISTAIVLLLLFSPVAAQETKTLKKGYLIAVNETSFDKCMSMIVNEDNRAFAQMISSGLCAVTKNGVQVYLEDVHMFSGVSEIRVKGSTATFWVNTEALH